MKSNYLNLLEKNLKRYLKKKVKITLSLIVSLLINGVAFGIDLPFDENRELNYKTDRNNSSNTGYGFKVNDYHGTEEEPLMLKTIIDITNSHDLTVTNGNGGDSSGIYIPGTDKITEFLQSDENSSFTVTNNKKIKVTGNSAYGIHVKFIPPETNNFNSLASVSTSKDSEEEEDEPLYAYPDINIVNNSSENKNDGIYVVGEVEAEGIKLDTPFSKVSIQNSGKIDSQVIKEINSKNSEEIAFGGATGINIFLEEEEEVPTNDEPTWISEATKKDKEEEEEISALPMNINVTNDGDINSKVENTDIARILGINVGQYDDHTLTKDTLLSKPQVKPALLTSLLEPETKSITELPEPMDAVTSKKGHGGSGGHDGGDTGCGIKPLDAMVFNNITNNGNININGNNLSAVQAVGINSRMAEGTQSTFTNGETGNININVDIKNARQTNIAEDPTAGNLYGINIFNSGRPSRANINNKGDIALVGTIQNNSKKNGVNEGPVGIQSFGIKAKSRGRDSVADINNTKNIFVSSEEHQNNDSMDYTYYNDTEGKEIFGARAVGIYGTTAGRGAYTEITNGNYDLLADENAMAEKRKGEQINIYEEVQKAVKKVYEDNLNKYNTFLGEANTIATINAQAVSDYGYAQAKGIWSTAEAIENSQFVYNSENSSIKAKATALERGAEALGIESESYQNTTINKGLIEVESNGKTAKGIGILAEVSEIEEEEMNEHARKPEFVGPDIGMPYNLPGKNGGKHDKEDTKNLLFTASLDNTNYESNEISPLKSDATSNLETKGNDTNKPKQPIMRIKNKFILNTGKITVNVNQDDDVESDFAIGAGIESSRIVPEVIKGTRVNNFKPQITSILKNMLLADSSEEIDGVAGATDTTHGEDDTSHGEPEQSLNQNITNNGLINVAVSGNTAIASGISSLTKVDVLFDTDNDGVSDGIDEQPFNGEFSKDLDGDGKDDKLDPDADGDGYDSVAFGGEDYFDNDSDNDGIPNRKDNDDDGDGILDIEDDTFNPADNAFRPITKEEYAELTDTPGGMPDNLVETSGIVEAEEVIINNNFENNGDLNVSATSTSENGLSIANGIATDVAWNGLQKPVYVTPPHEGDISIHVSENIEEDIIEKNYDHFINTGNINVISQADKDSGTALAFGIRDGNYYSMDDAANERTPFTKKYVGTMSEDNKDIEKYGIVNDGNIFVQTSGFDTKTFGIMSGYSKQDTNSKEEFVISTVKNNGNIFIHSENQSPNSIQAGIVAFADQQIEFLPQINEGGVLLAETEETDDHIDASSSDQPSFEDYVVKNPEKAIVNINNKNLISVGYKISNDGLLEDGNQGQSYGIYAGINPAEEVNKTELEENLIKLTKIDINENDLTSKPIYAQSQNEDEPKQIGTLYTVKYEGKTYDFVIHAAEDKGEDIPDSIYVVDKNGTLTPKVNETYKVGETELKVNNHGDIYVVGDKGTGIFLASGGLIENSGLIKASKAIVSSEENDVINLNDGSKIYGDIETGDGDDILSMSEKTLLKGNINLDKGNDKLTITNGNSIIHGNSCYSIDGGEGEDDLFLNASKNNKPNVIDSAIKNFENLEITGNWRLNTHGDINLGQGTFMLNEGSNLVIDMTESCNNIKRGKILAGNIVADDVTYNISHLDKFGFHDFSYNFDNPLNIGSNSGGKTKVKTSTYAWNANFIENILPAFKIATLDVTNSPKPNTSGITFNRNGFQKFANEKNNKLASILDYDYENNKDTSLADIYYSLENKALSTDYDEDDATIKLNEALENISGTEYTAFPFVQLSVNKAFGESVQSFMSSTDSNNFNDKNNSIIDTKNNTDAHQYMNILRDSKKYSHSDTENFDFDTYGVILGNDKKLKSGDRIGVTYGYARTSLDYDNDGNAKINTFHIGGYHKKESKNWLLESTLSFNYNKIDVDRVISIDTDIYKPSTDFDSYIISLGTHLSHDYNIDNWIIRPLAGINYSRIEQDGFKENITGIEKDSEGFNSLTSEVGVKALKEIYAGNLKLKLHFGMSWLHEYGDIYDDQTLKLAGDTYKVSGLGISDNTYRVGIGLDTNTATNWDFNINYTYDNGSSYDGNRISLGFKYEF